LKALPGNCNHPPPGPVGGETGAPSPCVPFSYANCFTYTYTFKCPNGNVYTGQVTHCVYYGKGCPAQPGSFNPLPLPSGGTAIGGGHGSSSGGGGGVVHPVVTTGTAGHEDDCWPLVDDGYDGDNCRKRHSTKTSSWVDDINRTYSDDGVDLVVKVPGGFVSVARHFEYGLYRFEPGSASNSGQTIGGLPVKPLIDGNKRYCWHFPDLDDSNGIQTDGKNGIFIQIAGRKYPSVSGQGSSGTGSAVFASNYTRVVANSDTFTVSLEDGVTKTYDATSGHLLSYRVNGQLLATYDYSSPGLVLVKDRNGNTAITYTISNGLVTSVIDYDSNEVDYKYSTQDGDLISVSQPHKHGVSSVFKAKYDYTTPSGGPPWLDSGTPSNLLTKKTYADGTIVDIVYYPAKQLGNVYTSFPADVSSVTSYQIAPDGITKSLAKKFQFSYYWDSSLQQYTTQVTHPSGSLETLVFDNQGNLLKRFVDGQVASIKGYDVGSQTTTDSEGNTTTETLDDQGNITSITAPDGSSYQYSYLPGTTLPTKTVDPTGYTTTIDYDSENKPQTMVIGAGTGDKKTILYTYFTAGDGSKNGLIETMTASDVTNKHSLTLTYDYDNHGNIIKVTHGAFPDVVQYPTYNGSGNPTEIIDQNGNLWQIGYDASGRKTSVTDPRNHQQAYGYDGAGNLAAITNVFNGTNRTTLLEYDQNHLVVSITNPAGKQFTIVRDAQGNALQAIDESGKAVSSGTFDDLNRLTSTADAVGNLTKYLYSTGATDDTKPSQIVTAKFTRNLFYDTNKRLDHYQDDIPAAGSQNKTSLVTKFGYDAVGRLTSVLDAEKHLTQYVYDVHGRLYQQINPLGDTVTYQYDWLGYPASITDGRSNTRYFTYDSRGHRTSAQTPAGITQNHEIHLYAHRQTRVDGRSQRSDGLVRV
jgi:YD repeat-containing protein